MHYSLILIGAHDGSKTLPLIRESSAKGKVLLVEPVPFLFHRLAQTVSGIPNVTLANVGMHGFLYCGGDVKNAGGNTILVGALFVAGNLTVNTTTIYYDSTVGNNILYENATISRVSWDETRTTW